ncbi:MAG TPA: PIN domain-containing protein [Bryobacteraceae bacterium]|nr:PIN domain-containing protein [Bryobacteraceae bacterium]
MTAIDTNILLYARDARDLRKQTVASHLITSIEDVVLLWQVACEYVAASRKLRSADYGQDEAWRDILDFAKIWPLRLPSPGILTTARELCVAYSLSTWDALLLGACVEANVTCLFSEDLQGGANIAGVEVVNPFA